MRKRSKNSLVFSIILLTIVGFFYYAFKTPEKKMLSGTVHIKNHSDKHVLYRNNVPFYIKGVAGKSNLQELVQIGGNTLRVYDTINLKNILLEAENLGISVIIDIPIPRYNETYNPYTIKEDNNALRVDVRDFIKRYKNYPALLFWNLGNEVEYPFTIIKNNFIKVYNDLIDIVHDEDPEHLVSTSINAASRKQTLSIHLHSPQIDLIGYNIFGNMKAVKPLISKISSITTRKIPYYYSEWGSNGPWEEKNTLWHAPVEPTSTKKGEQIRERYLEHIKADSNCLGGMAFYWGQKQERTHTWFNILDENGRKAQVFYELKKLWRNIEEPIDSIPMIKYMLVDNRGSLDNLIFEPNVQKKAELLLENEIDPTYIFEWEIYPEAWYYKEWDIEEKPKLSKTPIIKTTNNTVLFRTPKENGPYRIFVKIIDGNGNFATANTPFYVLQVSDEK